MEEKMKYSFGGISMNEISKGIRDNFYCLFSNEDRTIYISQDVYDQGEDDPEYNFSYKYLIVQEVIDDGESDPFLAMSIELMPSIDSFHPEVLKKMAEYFDIHVDDLTYEDIYFYAASTVGMAYEEIPLGPDDYWEDPKIMQKLDIAASSISTIDALRGFYLDAAHNIMGLTGWDYIYQYTRNEDIKDQIERKAKEYENA